MMLTYSSYQVKLSSKSFGAESSEVAAAALANNAATLKEVDLSDILAGRPVRHVMIPRK